MVRVITARSNSETCSESFRIPWSSRNLSSSASALESSLIVPHGTLPLETLLHKNYFAWYDIPMIRHIPGPLVDLYGDPIGPCQHVPIPVFTEGVDLESIVPLGQICLVCGCALPLCERVGLASLAAA